MSRILSIDYGERRLGLALSDPLGIIAKPLQIIDRKKTSNYFSEIVSLIKDKNINKIIVGLPLTMKGKDSEQTKAVRQFISKLTKIINILGYDK